MARKKRPPELPTPSPDEAEPLWLAFHGRQVVGIGHNSAEAYRAAKASRPKEEPTAITPAPASFWTSRMWEERLEAFFDRYPWAAVARAMLCAGAPTAYLVGGFVRNLLLGREVRDMDIVLDGDALEWGRRLADQLAGGFYVLDAERGFARVVIAGEDGTRMYVDLSRMEGSCIEEDLAHRDLTINAMAVNLCAGQFVDPFHGAEDLRRRILSLVTPQAVAVDPVRALRAVRLGVELGFRMTPALEEAIRRDAGGLASISAERIQQELHRMLAGPCAAEGLRRMSSLGLWRWTVPELLPLDGLAQSPPHQLSGWDHIVLTMARLEELLQALGLPPGIGYSTQGKRWEFLAPHAPALSQHLQQPLAEERSRWQALKWAALLHDIGKPLTRRIDELGRIRFFDHAPVGAQMAEQVMRRLRFSQREIGYVSACVAHHLQPMLLARGPELTRRAGYRYVRQVGDVALDVILLSLADIMAFGPHEPPAEVWEPLVRTAQFLIEYYLRAGGPDRLPRLVTGDDLIQLFGLVPGPAVGHWLERVREEQAAGTFSTRDEALRWLEQNLAEEKRKGNRT